jgi:LmbE family N-acetylglucosaminyl deacetylase
VIQLALPPGPLEILCLGAHPDDLEIGCGATLLTMAAAHTLRATVFIMTGTDQRRAEASFSAPEFLPGAGVDIHIADFPDGRLPAHWNAVKQSLEDLARTIRPELIFAPRADDAHQDHRLLGKLVPTVWRDALVLHYEIPKWDGDIGRVSHYVPITDDVAAQKVALIEKCFPSQARRDWWHGETFLSLMRLRGIECRAQFAEGFALSKAVIAP